MPWLLQIIAMKPLFEATMGVICTRQLQAGNSNDTNRRVVVSIGQETSTDKQHALVMNQKYSILFL